MLKRILLMILIMFCNFSVCRAVLYNYKELLADETEPPVGVSVPLVSIKLKALVTYPDPQFNSQHTKLNTYFSLKSESDTVIARMQKNGPGEWDVVPSRPNEQELNRRFALCRDLFSQLSGWRCQYVDLYQTGHFRLNPFPPHSDTAPGAAAVAGRELREFRNVLLRQGLFDREVVNFGFTFHYVTNEALGEVDPSRLVEEWGRWTGGRVRSGGGAGQSYGSLSYPVNCFSSWNDFEKSEGLMGSIGLPRGRAVDWNMASLDGNFNRYTYFSRPLVNREINAILEKAKKEALVSQLEVLEIEPSEETRGINRAALQELTRDHGIFVKFNLASEQRQEFWRTALRGNDNYYNFKVILSQPRERLEIPGASAAFNEMNERFHWVYGD